MPLFGTAVFRSRPERGYEMRRGRRLVSACLCALLAGCLPAPAAAQTQPYFSFRMDPDTASCGEPVRLQVQAYRTETTAAGFRLRIDFDEDALEFLGTETSGAVKSGTMYTGGGSGEVTCVYVCNPDKGYAPELSGTIASFLFQVEPDAPAGKTALTVATDQVCDYDGDPLEADGEEKFSLKLVPAPSSEAYLTSLKPSSGALEPEFSPSVHEYALPVGSGTDTVEFAAEAAESGTAKVSRKTLNGAGKQTPIVVTVTSEDKTETAQYLVTVEREAKPAGPAPAAGTQRTETDGSPVSSGGGAGRAEQRSAEPESGEGTAGRTVAVVESQPPSAGGQAAQQTELRPLVLVGDRMPSFLTGMLAAALCVAVGVILSLWLPIRPRKRP